VKITFGISVNRYGCIAILITDDTHVIELGSRMTHVIVKRKPEHVRKCITQKILLPLTACVIQIFYINDNPIHYLSLVHDLTTLILYT
jgi:hypothetical protein